MNNISEFLTLIITMGMFYIGYLQWKTSEKEIRKELFKNRYKKIYSPIRKAMTLFDMFTLGIHPYAQTKEDFMKAQTIKMVESFINYKHLLPKQLITILTNHINLLQEYLIKYTNVKTIEEDLKYARLVITEYLIILHFLSRYLFIEDTKPFNIYQVIFDFLQSTINFLLPICIQEKLIKYYCKKEAIEITTFSSKKQKDFFRFNTTWKNIYLNEY